MSQAELELTILMPCLNEAETLAACIDKAQEYLRVSGVSGEVLISDNGSTDGSQDIAVAHGARVVHSAERGYGAALITGIEGARGRFVVMGDSDMSYDFSALDPFVRELRGGADIVMGNRFKGSIKPGAMPFLHKYLGNPVLSMLGRVFFGVPAGDFHAGLRGFSRDKIRALGLRSLGMEFASEMVVKSRLAGLSFAEVPITLSPDGRSRPPHLKTWRDGWRHLRFLLLYSPRWLFIYPGLLAIALGLVGAVLLAPGAVRLTPHLVLDTHTLIVSCFAVLIGVQLVLFGALARQHAMAAGFLPPPRGGWAAFLSGLTLERLLLYSLAVFICGACGVYWSVDYWLAQGMGNIQYPMVLRVLIIALTAIGVSIQVASAAFLASLFSIGRSER